MFYSLISTFSTLAYTSQEVQFEPQDPGVSTGSDAVTENSIRELSGLGTQDPMDITVLIINWALGLLGLIFLVLVIYAGFLWMMAGGSEEQVTKAKGILRAALIGLVVVLVSYGTTYFVFEVLVNVTNAPI